LVGTEEGEVRGGGEGRGGEANEAKYPKTLTLKLKLEHLPNILNLQPFMYYIPAKIQP